VKTETDEKESWEKGRGRVGS